MSVAMLSKYEIVPGEDPEVTATRLHLKKNRAANPAEDMDFPPYQFFPYPTAMYREWNQDERELAIYQIAARNALNLEMRRDRIMAERLVGEFETKNVGQMDYVRTGAGVEVLSEVREKNDREHAALLDQGWADKPTEVKAATRRMQVKLAEAAAVREFDDRNLGEVARAELTAIDDASEDHVVDVAASRKQLQDAGTLPKGRK